MTVLQDITITNFRGFSEKSFQFDDKPLVLLTAPNGRGKTSLLDAIEWCLTGDVRRLHQVYDERNPTKERSIQLNEETILKNKDHLREQTKVELNLSNDGQMYCIIRLQDKDTLNRCSQVQVNGRSGNEAELLLNNLIDAKNFYNYNVCDMQKTYDFLRVGRSEMKEKFAAFTSNHSDAEHVVENLGYYCDDIDKRINNEQKCQVPESTILIYRNTLKKYEKSPEILPYDSRLLYPSELTNIQEMSANQLNNQLRTLYQCAYAHVMTLLNELKNDSEARERKKDLEALNKELIKHNKEIKETIRTCSRQHSVREKAEHELKNYQDINLGSSNIAGNSDELIKIGSKFFTEQYWEKSSNRIKGLKAQIEALSSEIETLIKGNKVIDALTAIVADKNGLIEYRLEQRHANPSQPVLCPVCGSEKFNTVTDDEITKQAQNYQAQHKELIEKKKAEVSNLKEQQRKTVSEQQINAKKALKEATDAAQKQVDNLAYLNNVSNTYFSLLEKLQKIDNKAYAQEKMLSTDSVREAIENNNTFIQVEEHIIIIRNEIKRVLKLVQYSDNNELSQDALLENIRESAYGVPEDVAYDESLLRNKISSIRSRIQNIEYLDASKQLKKAEEKNTKSNQKIENLKLLSSKAKERSKEILDVLQTMNEKEYDNVGPFLYKIYCKLSRDVNISGINLKGAKGNGLLMLTDRDGKPIQNMLSDGQLSVLMLSYFFSNVFRFKDSGSFKIYFLDDITSTMDDINMLAFFDLIKYQLSSENSAIDQLFFTTCDSRIQNIFSYKMDQCGLEYKEIGAKEFSIDI